jgi:hypothetical protein
MRFKGEIRGFQGILCRCDCGEITIKHHGYYGLHLMEQYALTCKTCNKRLKVIAVESEDRSTWKYEV